MIPDCQKRFNAAYQDLKSIVDEDVSVHDARCVGFYSFQILKKDGNVHKFSVVVCYPDKSF